MHFIYIKNYTKISRELKIAFFKFVDEHKAFKFSSQKIVLDDNALLIELTKESDPKDALGYIKEFFESDERVEVKAVEKILQESKNLVLLFKDNQMKRIAC